MGALAIPFNITFLDLTPEKLQGIKPVTVLDIFDRSTTLFHEDGLFSTSIFGRVGDERRNRRFSYIDIKLDIFHPVIFNVLGKLKGLYLEIMSGKSYAVWDKEIKDFVRSTPVDGKTGFAFFLNHWKDIEFENRDSDKREQNVMLLKKFKNKALLNKVIVIPAGLRDLEIQSDGRQSENEINTLYKKIIALSNSVITSAIKNNPEMLNNTRYSLQLAFNAVYDNLLSLIEGKKKLLLGRWASRNVFNGTRNVITSMNIDSTELGYPGNISCNDTIVGLYQFIKGALPLTKFHLKSGFLSKVFQGPSAPVILVNKNTLKSEAVNIKASYYDAWMTDEGIEKVINHFSEESLRHKPLEIEGRYVGLLYNDPVNRYIKLFQDIDDVPPEFNRAYVAPVTFCELIYLSVYSFANQLPCFVTRYPITGMGSIYPSKIYLKPTVATVERCLLDDNWAFDKDKPVAYEFPTKTDFVNSMSPSSLHLSMLGADFDGDTCSLTILYSDESIKEVNEYLQSKRYYVGTNGRVNFSTGTDTVSYVLANMTGP